jgi:hypothetical protein
LARARDHLEAAFRAQPFGAPGAERAQHVAQTKLAEALPETSRLLAIECRASLCRVESEHQDVERFNQFVEKGLFNTGGPEAWTGPFFSAPAEAPEGRIAYMSFVALEGGSLPPLDGR